MMHQFWRLSEAGADNLGLACTADGLLLGRRQFGPLGSEFLFEEGPQAVLRLDRPVGNVQ